MHRNTSGVQCAPDPVDGFCVRGRDGKEMKSDGRERTGGEVV